MEGNTQKARKETVYKKIEERYTQKKRKLFIKNRKETL